MPRVKRSRTQSAVTWALLLAMSATLSASLQSQTPSKTGASRTPVFEVVSIRENTSHDGGMSWSSNSSGISMKNLQLDMMIRSVFGLVYSNEGQIVGLPPWAKTEHFDLEARVSEEDAPLLKDLNDAQRDEMLLAVLVDRFHMKAHLETKDGPVYALVVAKGGSKLTPVTSSSSGNTVTDSAKKDAVPTGGYMTSDKEVHANAIPIESIVSIMTSLAQREIVDRTGLKGKYSFDLKFTPDREADETSAKSQDNLAPPFFTAIQEQLGLRLEGMRGPVRAVIVDQIEKPSAN